jgi:ATP-dependent Clp protease ATP-binding subunit ClpB
MIGAPPGYVGFDDAGQLTEAIRRRPYAVVLLDEIEKAHADVLNVLLQLLDDGRLTDGKGRTVDFKNTVVIMTSNLGSQYLAEHTGRPGEALEPGVRDRIMDALRGHFRPEFLNRVDEIIVFHSLGREHLARIVDIQLGRLLRRLEARKIRLELTDKARQLLVEEGYDPVYGARPLKRTIQRELLDPLAMAMLQGAFADGDTIRVEAAGNDLAFVKGADAESDPA